MWKKLFAQWPPQSGVPDRFHMTKKNMEIIVSFHRPVGFTIFQILKHVFYEKRKTETI